MDDLTRIRNISIIAHIDAGKTTTTERFLYYSGKTHRIGDIDDGSTVMDYLEEERLRGITIVSAAASIPWDNHLIHLIDTPGHIDFTAEVERSLRVIDGAIVIFSGVEGVEAQSEKVWHQADYYRVPRMAFINKLDRIGASFGRVVSEINEKFGNVGIPVQLPVGIENQFRSLIDLITMELLTFDGDSGETVCRGPIPDGEAEEASLARESMIEKLADVSDEIATLYLDGEVISPEILNRELRRLTMAQRIVPIFAGSAKRNIGIQPLLNSAIAYLPSPADITRIPALSASDEEPVSLTPDSKAPFTGFIFKLVASTTADLYYLRTYTGTLKAGDKLYVPRLNDTIRVQRLLRLYAKQTEVLEEVGPGDIVGMIGPRDLLTGDTLCERHKAVIFEQMNFPEPVLSMAVEPKSTKEKDRLDEALRLIVREDPTLELSLDENTGQRLLSGMGELHLQINVKRLDNEFHVPVRCGEPRVAYRETVNRPVTVTHTFQKFIGETELYAQATLTLTPKDHADPPFEVSYKARAANVSKQFKRAALEALSDGVKTGGNSGYPLIYISARIDELEVMEGKTNEGAILGAVLQALNEAISEAGTHLLEPLMRLEILTPEEQLGEVTNDVTIRRGLIMSVGDLGNLKRVSCEVPLSEMFGFSKQLPKVTGGRGSFSMEPCGYKAVES